MAIWQNICFKVYILFQLLKTTTQHKSWHFPIPGPLTQWFFNLKKFSISLYLSIIYTPSSHCILLHTLLSVINASLTLPFFGLSHVPTHAPPPFTPPSSAIPSTALACCSGPQALLRLHDLLSSLAALKSQVFVSPLPALLTRGMSKLPPLGHICIVCWDGNTACFLT